MIIEISVAVISVAFVALVIYLIVMMKTLRKTLGKVDQTLEEAKMAIQQTQLLEADLRKKMGTLDPLFNSVENVGDILECKTAAYKELKSHSLREEDSDQINVADLVALAGLGIRLWNKFNKRR
jgi:uncharacterized protein YoxC